MLHQANRLTRTRDFAILFLEGQFVGGELVNAKVWKVNPEKYPKRGYHADDLKIGFVVTTKISKRAVERNRAKRQMREVVRLLLKDGQIKSGYLVAIMAKGNILKKDYKVIEQGVVDVLRRARVLV